MVCLTPFPPVFRVASGPASRCLRQRIYDDRLVLVETLSTELSLRDPEDIEPYARFFELLWEVALRGDDAIALITELVAQLRSTGNPAAHGKMRP